MPKYDWGIKIRDGYEDGHAKFGYCDLIDADGNVVDAYIQAVDTDTGECVQEVRDENNNPVYENGEAKTEIRVYKVPLTIRPRKT